MNRPYLSVVIPAYNEAKRIERTLKLVIAYLTRRGLSHEILVVDDGSTDETVAVVSKIAETHPPLRILRNNPNRGKGYSVKTGILHSRGEFVLFSDADLSTPIEEIEKLLHWLGEDYAVVIGSRSLSGSDIRLRQPWYRETMGKVFNLFVRLVAISGIKDTQCGFKCFQREAARDIFSRLRCDRFGFDVEALWVARRLGYGIKEVPVVWYNNEQSRVNPVTDASRMLLDLFQLRINDWRGRYVSAPSHDRKQGQQQERG